MKYPVNTVGKIRLNTEAIAAKNAKEHVLSNDLQLIYSALCLTLWEKKKMDTDEIAELLNDVQMECVALLNEYPKREEWVQHCEEKTGIHLYA